MQNFYSLVKNKTKFENAPDAMLIHPYRLLITGASGSGKTNVLLNLFYNNPVFDRVYLFAKSLDSDLLYTDFFIPVLEKLGKKMKTKILKIATNDLSELPDIDSIGEPKLQKLMIFDDYMFDKNNDIGEYFARARKKNMSMVYITQNISRTPLDIRRNIDSIAVTKIKKKGDMNILADNFMMTTDEFKKLYNYKEKNEFPNSFLLRTESGGGNRIYINDKLYA